jgi:hypothetical protein
MKDRRTQAHQRRSKQQQPIALRHAEDNQADEARAHADRQRVGHRSLIRVHADCRLQQRGRHLEREGQKPDLHEIEPVIGLQDRVDRGQQRLHHVVDHVANRDGDNDRQRGFRGERAGGGDSGVGQERSSGQVLHQQVNSH